MNFTMVSMAIGEAWEPIADFVWEQNYNWCKREDVLFISYDSLSEIIMKEAPRPPSWYRLIFMKGILQNRGGTVVWVDADAIIKPNISVRDLDPLTHSKKLLTVDDYNGANCGLISMVEGGWSRSILDRWWDEALPEEINHSWWENATFKRLLRESRIVRENWIGLPTEQILIHAAGVPVEKKLEWLKERSRS